MTKFLQGFFKPRHPEKYKGDPTNIVYRSSWELKLLMYLDENKNILSYSSEELFVPYRCPISGKIRRYFPDVVVTKINKSGKKETVMIEVKPSNQTRPPKKQKEHTKTYLTEVKTWGVNSAKWEAAKKYCADRGWKFQILTEKELGIVPISTAKRFS